MTKDPGVLLKALVISEKQALYWPWQEKEN